MARRFRWPTVAALAGVVVLAAYVVVISPVVVDRDAVTGWDAKVSPALDDLNGVGDVPGLDADGPAVTNPCSVDTGELFDLNAYRSWSAAVPGRDAGDLHPSVTEDTAGGFERIVDSLLEDGWRVHARGSSDAYELPSGLTYDFVDLTADTPRRGLLLQLSVDDEGVLAVINADRDDQACRWRWRVW